MDTRTKAVIQELINQRNRAMDVIAEQAGEIVVLREEIALLKERQQTDNPQEA